MSVEREIESGATSTATSVDRGTAVGISLESAIATSVERRIESAAAATTTASGERGIVTGTGIESAPATSVERGIESTSTSDESEITGGVDSAATIESAPVPSVDRQLYCKNVVYCEK